MPRFANVKADLHCLKCTALQIYAATFQWGYCPNWYTIGSAIGWRACPDGRILPWAEFPEHYGGNIGDPEYKTLIVTDLYNYGPEAGVSAQCTNCRTVIAGTATKITDGYITSVWIYEAGDFDDEVDIYLVASDGTLTMMREWMEHPALHFGCS